MKEIVIASKNKHKIEEISDVLIPLGFHVLSLFDFEEVPDIIEDGATFSENALIKAKTLALILQKTVIADDSGLEVFALHNEPGVYSARYAGENKSYLDNNLLLLQNMKDLTDRRARFVTSMCIYYLDKEPIFVEDYLEGEIGYDFVGENGFGYDPIFYIPSLQKHLAELTLRDKNQISHRAKCLKKLIGVLIQE
ncbi:MAG: RdgB/HAM1 family non-canonical purine NTP pyrophosphatase [Bacilli bacterium]|nr:RdgB/HAM1 family non-canonical purine NTP pyrophosphatase [Bacilli bacterium]